MSSRFRFSRLRRVHGDAEPSSRSLRRYLGAALALTTLFGILPVEPAAADGNDFSIVFRGADADSYDHLTGAPLPGGSNFAESDPSLQGGDFACGERVVYLAAIDVDDVTTANPQTIEVDLAFATQSTGGGGGVGIRDLISADANTGDPAHTANGTFPSTVNVLAETFPNPPVGNGTATVQITGLEAGETFILRLVVELGCDPGTTPQGNIQAGVATARVTAPVVDVIQVGNQTINLMQAGDIVRTPDVTVTKTALSPIVTEGGTATFTIEVTNTGGTANEVTLTDILPTAGGPGAWTESPDIAACSITLGVLSCNFGSLAPGATASVTVTKQLGTGCAQLPNTAVVSAANEPLSATGNNTAQATITVTCALLSIAKVADDPAVSAGDQVGFTITVINGGDAAATNVVVQDDLPDALGLNWSLSPAVDGCAITGDPGASQVLDCTLPTVPANGGTVVIHVVSPTTAASCGTIVNRVGLTGEPAVASITIACPDVEVVKTADATPINTGAAAAFTIVVTNLGPGTATGVTLSDPLPAGIAWSEDSDDCSIGGNTLSCIFGSLAPLATRTIHLTGTTDAADCGPLVNTATVLATNEAADVLANNESTASIVVNCPDVEVEKTADDPSIKAGENAGFEIVVTNNGPGTATDVTLTDTLPAGITWTEDSPFCTITGNVLSCSFGDMPVGESHTINLTGTTDAADCGTISNTSIIAAVNEAAGADGNNSATATIKIVCPVYGSDPDTLPTEQPYEPAPGDQPTVGGENETTGDPGAGTAGTTVPVTPAPESANDVVDAVIDVVQSPLTLPRTGMELIQQAVAGLGLIGLGLVLMAVRRRRSSSTSA